MGIMSGRYGYRELGTFAKANKKDIAKHLGIKTKQVPSYVTIRYILMNIDFNALNTAFYSWAKEHVEIKEGEWFGIDGKAIKSTVSNYNNEHQNFIALVSVFSQKKGQVIQVGSYENKKESEVNIVRELLETLDLKDVVFTLDALHCKKNSKNHNR